MGVRGRPAIDDGERKQAVGVTDRKIEPDEADGAPAKLSKRQKQLIVMLDQGLSNREIAEVLGISEHTVKVHLWRLFKRIGVNSRTQMLHYARVNGFLAH